MSNYDLYRLIMKELKNGSSDLVTRPSGHVIRERIERDIMNEPDGGIVRLDFSRIGIIDYSCADEIVAKLVSRLTGGEYGNRYILLTGLNENQRENIEVALERKDLAVMAEMRDGSRLIVGDLNNYLRETLKLIEEKGEITAGELSKVVGLPANTSGMRLLNLYRKHLARRRDVIRDGGRVWVYERL